MFGFCVGLRYKILYKIKFVFKFKVYSFEFMKSKKRGRPRVKDRRVGVTFTAIASKVKEARKKSGLKEMNKALEVFLYDYISV
jgi:hypothetical protein